MAKTPQMRAASNKYSSKINKKGGFSTATKSKKRRPWVLTLFFNFSFVTSLIQVTYKTLVVCLLTIVLLGSALPTIYKLFVVRFFR
jgi:hypothetical protein